jgi:RNA polymerase sigma-70 factor (ECF subfamily)
MHGIEVLLAELRPKLHRYCARMAGSTIDGEDIVQEACLKALQAWQGADIANPAAWIFRIAHNAALDFLRRRRGVSFVEEEVLEMLAMSETPEHDAMTASIHYFLRLPALQRSAVILKDVLEHSIEEIAVITGVTAASAKSALQRGRMALRELRDQPEEVSTLPEDVAIRLTTYVAGFRNGDFDAVRAMLAEDVRLDLVAKLTRRGKSEVGEYYGRYSACEQWEFAAGIVEGRPAMLVYDRDVSLEQPAYFVALTFEDGQVATVHDFLFARYALEGVHMRRFP